MKRPGEAAPAAPLALRLARWAHDLQPGRDDLELARQVTAGHRRGRPRGP